MYAVGSMILKLVFQSRILLQAQLLKTFQRISIAHYVMLGQTSSHQ